MNQAGKSQNEIGQAIGFSQSTVSKELSRNRGMRGYRPVHAQRLSDTRKADKRARGKVLEGNVLLEVERRLRLDHSPEQVSGAMLMEGLGEVSHETLYQHISLDKKAGGSLYTHLRINSKRRYRRRSKAGRSKIPNRVGIEERPASVENLTRYGDWEVDLIEGAKGTGYVLSLYERKTMTARLAKLETKGAEETARAIIAELSGHRARTLTYDNGAEFSRHLKVSEALGARGYFCNPYSSWEKGGVENLNGLVRQYLPKGSSFADLTQEQLKDIEHKLNTRPRKSMNFTTPDELKHKIAA